MHSFNLPAFESLPENLRPSDYVDFLLFLGNLKRAIRLGKNSNAVYQLVVAWCQKYKFSYYVSSSGYMYISKAYLMARLTCMIDDSPFPHAFLLGLLLGYPICCAKRIANIGEQNIDQWEREHFAGKTIKSEFKIINPIGYLSGTSLISHIPCCTHCKKSFEVAKVSLSIIKSYCTYPCFARWKMWI